MKSLKLVLCLGLLVVASTCFAQMYTISDLDNGAASSSAHAINNLGRVVGVAGDPTCGGVAFRTAPNSAINPDTDYLSCNSPSYASDINPSGQVVGGVVVGLFYHGFRTAPNSPINLKTDDLGTLGSGTHCYMESDAYSINASGQVVGASYVPCYAGDPEPRAFRTAADRRINPATDDLGTLGGQLSLARGINASGQVVGYSSTSGDSTVHAFRTAPNRRINPATDDLGTLFGTSSYGTNINAIGQVVGNSYAADGISHVFRTAPNRPINPATDDLGPGFARAIDSYGQVVGIPPFLYSTGGRYDLNGLIPDYSNCMLADVYDINDAGQIAAMAYCGEQFLLHAVRLDPIYKAFVQPPINARGTSAFSKKRGMVPVKFSLSQSGKAFCSLLPATMGVTRIGAAITFVSGKFRFDPSSCQYIYNLATKSLGVGSYRVDISINGIMVGHAVFGLQ